MLTNGSFRLLKQITQLSLCKPNGVLLQPNINLNVALLVLIYDDVAVHFTLCPIIIF
jgi:hypothetical protein